jgi:hypothetical protein
MSDNRLDLIKKNEKPLISGWCLYKWHYDNKDKLWEAFDNDEFGLQTNFTFYPSGVWLWNNADDDIQNENLVYEKQVTYPEFITMMYNGDIDGNLYDWEDVE